MKKSLSFDTSFEDLDFLRSVISFVLETRSEIQLFKKNSVHYINNVRESTFFQLSHVIRFVQEMHPLDRTIRSRLKLLGMDETLQKGKNRKLELYVREIDHQLKFCTNSLRSLILSFWKEYQGNDRARLAGFRVKNLVGLTLKFNEMCVTTERRTQLLSLEEILEEVLERRIGVFSNFILEDLIEKINSNGANRRRGNMKNKIWKKLIERKDDRYKGTSDSNNNSSSDRDGFDSIEKGIVFDFKDKKMNLSVVIENRILEILQKEYDVFNFLVQQLNYGREVASKLIPCPTFKSEISIKDKEQEENLYLDSANPKETSIINKDFHEYDYEIGECVLEGDSEQIVRFFVYKYLCRIEKMINTKVNTVSFYYSKDEDTIVGYRILSQFLNRGGTKMELNEFDHFDGYSNLSFWPKKEKTNNNNENMNFKCKTSIFTGIELCNMKNKNILEYCINESYSMLKSLSITSNIEENNFYEIFTFYNDICGIKTHFLDLNVDVNFIDIFSDLKKRTEKVCEDYVLESCYFFFKSQKRKFPKIRGSYDENIVEKFTNFLEIPLKAISKCINNKYLKVETYKLVIAKSVTVLADESKKRKTKYCKNDYEEFCKWCKNNLLLNDTQIIEEVAEISWYWKFIQEKDLNDKRSICKKIRKKKIVPVSDYLIKNLKEKEAL